jgi:uncharacterized protein
MKRKKLQHPIQLLFMKLLWAVMFAAFLYTSACVFLFFIQTRMIFVPTAVIEKTPELFNLQYEEVWLPVFNSTGKAERIHGWWIKANQPESKVLLYLHGNGFNIGANIAQAKIFQQMGFSVLLIDYRGYGRSEGSFPSEVQVYQDAATAWNYLVKDKKIPPSQILIYGHSLGGAIAIDLAAKYPDAAGLIVESTFTSIIQVIDYRNTFWMFPVDLILTQGFESIDKVSKLKMPILFIHGTADSTIPAFMSEQLYNAAPEPKQLILIDGAGHNNVANAAPYQYVQGVKSFLEEVFVKY